jgi:hypothetical protein
MRCKKPKPPVSNIRKVCHARVGADPDRSGACATAHIGVMTYAFARIGAVVAMKVEDYYPASDDPVFRDDCRVMHIAAGITRLSSVVFQ